MQEYWEDGGRDRIREEKRREGHQKIKNINAEGRFLVKRLKKFGWFIFNAGRRMKKENGFWGEGRLGAELYDRGRINVGESDKSKSGGHSGFGQFPG